jgi:hypothetical protein
MDIALFSFFFRHQDLGKIRVFKSACWFWCHFFVTFEQKNNLDLSALPKSVKKFDVFFKEERKGAYSFFYVVSF